MRNILPIILIIVSIVVFFMLINPQYHTYQDLNNQVGQVNDALSKVKQLRATLDALLSKENSISSADLARLNKIVPNNVDNIRLFLDLQGIASHYNIALQNIAVGNQSNQDTSSQSIGPNNVGYGVITLSFNVSTSYENLILFMRDIERSLRIVEIKSMSFNNDNASQPDHYKVSLTLGTYWLKAPTANTTAATQ